MMNETVTLYSRPIRHKAFLSMAKCVDNTKDSEETVEQCLRIAQLPIEKTQNVVTEEMQNFQNRMQQCMNLCYSTARASLPVTGGDPKGPETVAAMKVLSDCAGGCLDTSKSQVPALSRRLVDQLKRL